MLTRIAMPSLSATMEEGMIVSWRVKEGHRIQTGGILAEIESDKSVFEYECPCEGVVRKLLVQEGQSCPVQATIAIIGEENEEIPAEWLAPAGGPKPRPSLPLRRHGGAEQRESGPKGRISISPRARKLAKELGVDIEKVSGTGPGGRIESSDIENAAKGPKPPEGARAVRSDPCGYQSQGGPIEAGDSALLRESLGRHDRRHGLSGIARQEGLVQRPVDESHRRRPGGRAFLERDVLPTPATCRTNPINLGLAVETPKGVVIAVIEDVAGCDDAELMDRIASAVEAVRGGDTQAVKTSGACMTISNIGMFRTDLFIPIIHPGEAAILGIGSIAQRPVVVAGAWPSARRCRSPCALTIASPTAWRPRGFSPPWPLSESLK